MATCSLQRNVGDLERLGCLVLGGCFLIKGIVSRRASRTLLGGLLVYRGLTGNCKAYEALGIDTRSGAEKTRDA
ncbi:MAG: DUF2892 domain-containing protein [Terrimicrobiaceae bacterium]|nr:DUF2892 domain-containing protein [Terrimicrobiaceae bacterium]